MAEKIPQSTTIRVPLQAYLSSDGISAATGKTIAVQVSKNGAAYANPSAGATNATEIASGSYYVDLSTTDTGTLGPVFVRGTSSGVNDVVAIYNVVKATNGGLTALPDAAANADGGLPILSVSGTTLAYTVSTITTYTGNTKQTGDSFALIGSTGSGLTSLAQASLWTSTIAGRIDAAVSSRMATYTQPTGFLAATFPGTVASTTNITAAAGIAVSSIGANVITAASIATNAIDADSLATDAVTEIQSGLATAVALSSVSSLVASVISSLPPNFVSLVISAGGIVNANAVTFAGADVVISAGSGSGLSVPVVCVGGWSDADGTNAFHTQTTPDGEGGGVLKGLVLDQTGLDQCSVSGKTVLQHLSLQSSACFGVLGISGSTFTYKDIADGTTTRIVETCDATGRTGVVVTAP